MKPVEFIDVRCPKCNEVVLSHTKNDYLYGSPVRECPFCKAEVIDPYYHEIAIDGIRKDPKRKKQLIKDEIISIALTIILAFFNLLAIAMENGSVIMIALMIFTFSLIFLKLGTYFHDSKKIKESYYRQTAESETRLSEKAYAQKLAGLGYKVPENYL